MRRLLLLVLLLTLLPAAPAGASTLCLPECAPVVVVGVPGLRWTDVGPATPALQRLAREGAVGALSVKAVPAVSCRADGWLTLGAGNRAVAAGVQREPCGDDLPDDLRSTVAANREEQEGAVLGALVRAVERTGHRAACVAAFGAGPVVAVGEPFARGAGTGRCQVELHEAPAVAGQGTGRVADAVAADRTVEQLLDGAGTVLVVGLSEAPGDDEAGLHVAIARGPAFEPGALRSASTRRAPYVQLVDVAPTVLDLLGVDPPDAMAGQPWRSVGEQPSPADLADVALQAEQHKRVTVPFFVALLGAELALLLLALWRRRGDLAELVALTGVAALGTSYLANLVPWWRSPAPLLTLLGVVVLLAAAVATASSRPRAAIFAGWRGSRRVAAPPDEDRRGELGVLRPIGLVSAFPAGVLVLDLLTGAHLQMSSVAGYSPLVAGRFAGIGNVAFGVLAACALLATAALTRRVAAVAAVGVLVVAADGAPPWGSDVGGVLALVPAFVLLAMLLSGRRVSLLRLALAGLAGAAVVTAFALADWSRPEQDRTHLGRFVQDVADGTAGTLLRRKAEAVLSLLFASPVTALLPLVVAAAVYLVVRPPRPLAAALQAAPAWRAGLLATGLACAIGFAVNDSGAAVPALALTVVLPGTAAVVLRARRAQQEPVALLA
jgi:hypothetical protein